MTAEDVLRSLLARHPRDKGWAAFSELSDGTGYRRSPRRIDLYVVNTWPSVNRSVAYEIKVSRGDFARELAHPDKRAGWETLARECNFATPAGLLRPDEIPEGWGLVEITRTGLARIKKHPQQRAIPDWPPAFMLSIAARSCDPPPALPVGSWSLPSGRVVSASDQRRLADRLRQRAEQRERPVLNRHLIDRQRRELERLGAIQRSIVRCLPRGEGHLRDAQHAREVMGRLVRGGGAPPDLAVQLRAIADEIG